MQVLSVSLRDFRSYRDAEVALGPGLTVVSGPNGAGKTNLLEAIYFGSVGRSPRTANEREVVRFGAQTTRVVVRCEADDGQHEVSVGFEPGQPKRLRVDGATVERLIEAPERPLVSVFLPDRLDLIKGAPSTRRAHVDQLVAALWPARVHARRSYTQALAQRNALIGRVRAGAGSRPRPSRSSPNALVSHVAPRNITSRPARRCSPQRSSTWPKFARTSCRPRSPSCPSTESR